MVTARSTPGGVEPHTVWAWSAFLESSLQPKAQLWLCASASCLALPLRVLGIASRKLGLTDTYSVTMQHHSIGECKNLAKDVYNLLIADLVDLDTLQCTAGRPHEHAGKELSSAPFAASCQLLGKACRTSKRISCQPTEGPVGVTADQSAPPTHASQPSPTYLTFCNV